MYLDCRNKIPKQTNLTCFICIQYLRTQYSYNFTGFHGVLKILVGKPLLKGWLALVFKGFYVGSEFREKRIINQFKYVEVYFTLKQ